MKVTAIKSYPIADEDGRGYHIVKVETDEDIHGLGEVGIRSWGAAIEKALEREEDCSAILQTLAACRGALNGLMAQLLEDQIRNHVLDRKPSTDSVESAEKLISIVKSYFK